MSCTDTGLVQGKNAIFQVYKGGQYRDFAVATDISVDFKTELKSVKTIGDGVWARSRPQSIGYTISLGGLVKVGTFDDPIGFDLLDYQTQFVDLQYKIIFEEGAALKVIMGNAIVDSSKFSGPAEGFATSNFEMVGNGKPMIIDNLTSCNISITSVVVGDRNTTDHTVPITLTLSTNNSFNRIEYTLNGGDRQEVFDTVFSVPYPYLVGSGNYVYVFYPICDNGYEGVSNTVTIFYNGGGNPGCDLSITSISTGIRNTTAHTIPVTLNTSGTGTLSRFEYTLNGGARQTSYTNTISLSYPYTLGSPNFVYVFYPICTNNEEGSSNSITLYYYGGAGNGDPV